MVKYINTATVHLGEDATLYKNRIWNSIYTLSRKELKNTFEELLSKTLEIKPQKYATVHLGEDATLYKNRIWNSIYTLSRKELKNTFEELLSKTLEIKPQKYDAVEESFKYLKTNWKGIITRIKEKSECGTCCAEGLVSHILSERLSSRPMGWSKQGCDNMAKLIAATLNGEDMLELLKLNVKKKLQEEHEEIRQDLARKYKVKQQLAKHEEIRQDLARKYKVKQQLAKEPVMIPGTEKVGRKYIFKIVNNAIIF